MIKPVIQKNPYKPDCGDILSGGEYLVRKVDYKEKLGDYLWISLFGNNPWNALERLGIESKELKETFKYKCPFSDNIYYHFTPVVLVLNNGVDSYRKYYEEQNGIKDPLYTDYLFDTKWGRRLSMEVLPEATTIQMAMLGHGYTEGTLPSDGSGDFINVLIELDNGDFLFGHCWEWYNK